MNKNDNKKSKQQIEKFYDDQATLEEQFSYNPYGKGGGGAPLRDQFGNSITTRKPNLRGDMLRTHFMGKR